MESPVLDSRTLLLTSVNLDSCTHELAASWRDKGGSGRQQSGTSHRREWGALNSFKVLSLLVPTPDRA